MGRLDIQSRVQSKQQGRAVVTELQDGLQAHCLGCVMPCPVDGNPRSAVRVSHMFFAAAPHHHTSTGLTNQPSIANIGSGASTIVTDDSGATDVTLLITLPSYNLNSGGLRW